MLFIFLSGFVEFFRKENPVYIIFVVFKVIASYGKFRWYLGVWWFKSYYSYSKAWTNLQQKKDIDQTEVCPLLIVIAQNLPKHSKCLLVWPHYKRDKLFLRRWFIYSATWYYTFWSKQRQKSILTEHNRGQALTLKTEKGQTLALLWLLRFMLTFFPSA